LVAIDVLLLRLLIYFVTTVV